MILSTHIICIVGCIFYLPIISNYTVGWSYSTFSWPSWLRRGYRWVRDGHHILSITRASIVLIYIKLYYDFHEIIIMILILLKCDNRIRFVCSASRWRWSTWFSHTSSGYWTNTSEWMNKCIDWVSCDEVLFLKFLVI